MIKIGFTKKTHGLKGDIKINVEERYLEDFIDCDHVYLELNGSKVPYFIEDVRMGNEIIIKFEDVEDVNAAKLLGSKELFLKPEQILSPEQRKISVQGAQYFDIEGFEMINNNISIGTIKEVSNMPGQIMALVETKNGTRFVPLNEHFVKNIDRNLKQINVELPEGLLDL